MKKVLTAIFCMLILCSLAVFAEDAIKVYLDGEVIEFDTEPVIIDGRTMVPVRGIFEKMGAEVTWDDSTKTASAVKDGTYVTMTLDSKVMYINGNPLYMDASPVIVDSRTLAPARYVAEAFGANVVWNEKSRTVVICSDGVYSYADYPYIPDVGKCYGVDIYYEEENNGCRIYYYLFTDTGNAHMYDAVFNASLEALGNYALQTKTEENGTFVREYKESNAVGNVFEIAESYTEDGSYFWAVTVYDDSINVNVTIYAPDGSSAKVASYLVDAYIALGWYRTWEETRQTLYSNDDRTITVFKSQVPEYLALGWYVTKPEERQTLYAVDGRVIEVNVSEVKDYVAVGWFESEEEARSLNHYYSFNHGENPTADGYYYRTPSGKKYHFDPNCGGKNSYRTNNITGLSPCTKCAI